jgi:hypothetical protein
VSYQLNREQLLRLARMGARERLEELRREQKAIEALIGRENTNGQGGSSGKRRRRGMSAAARRAVSARMKKYCTKPLRGSYSHHPFLAAA